ncbi:hydantoinase/oxoprolinase family protein [Alphaproteobacteria bacterium KMM 3653]|uniref:Hydantoinase/oxoprolinase family protein n=1 Tax=Harenicola maris TaxID=2841044 RepID=A0AAP2CP16_9RHOB|nr:hydantoinase/oxoprolinase family protein [Harenicola maris]
MSSIDLALAVDIGGTFTDVALRDGVTGDVWRAKTPSTPSDPSVAFLDGIRRALADAGRDASELTEVLHGTTVATNMILEGKGARAALVTTAGFRHVLAIGRQDIPRKANLYNWEKPDRPIPPDRIVEVIERVAGGGDVLTPLDEASVIAAAETLRELDVDAVAVCLLHAFANPAHEMRVAQILREQLPDVAVTASTDVLPVVREYERTLASVLNAIVMPGVTTYVQRLEQRLIDEGVTAPLLLMQSNGGVAGSAKIRQAPALTALSGPAAGVVGALAEAQACGINDIVTVDIGGTSADICLIADGHIGLTQNGQVGDWPLPLPMVDMVTIGAGGGSIASVDEGTLSVGPRSAGAMPGPAAYMNGGTEPTVTDAHVVLGHLPARLLGGRMALDPEAARRVVQTGVADPLGLSVEDAARGILAIADNHMVGAVRVVSVERGHDPRDFTLVPFGGAGPLHGCALADLMGINRVLIARAPGVLCADGLLDADLKAEFSKALPEALPAAKAQTDDLVAELEAKAKDWFAEEEVAPARQQLHRVALMRYHGQGGELAVPMGGDLVADFAASHKALYGFALDAEVELVTVRVEATGLAANREAQNLASDTTVTPIDTAEIAGPDGPVTVPVVDRAALGAGASLPGPMILSQLDTTILITADWLGTVQPSGAILLTRKDNT